jgi:periplasmic protein CpxP/Spy
MYKLEVRALFFVASAIAFGLTVAPLAVKAQPESSAPAQNREQKGSLQSLGLSDTQKSQIREIREKTRAQLKKVLTSQQQEQLNAAMQNPQARRAALRNLNLTQDQKNQMQQIMKSQETQIEAILSPQQRQQLQQYRENMPSLRQQNKQ